MKKIKGNVFAAEGELTNREFWFYMDYLRTNGYDELYQKGLVDLSSYDDITRALIKNYHYSEANSQWQKSKKKEGDFMDYPVLDISYESAKAYCPQVLSLRGNPCTPPLRRKVRLCGVHFPCVVG